MRWSEACAAAIAAFRNRFAISDEGLVLLGFAVTMREVLANAYVSLGLQCPAYMILTYDVPTKEEIASKVKGGDRVLLITDVISTGSLVESVSSVVRRNNATVAGVVSLVDARHANAATCRRRYRALWWSFSCAASH